MNAVLLLRWPSLLIAAYLLLVAVAVDLSLERERERVDTASYMYE